MTLLIAGLLLFFAPHCVSIFNEKWRDQIVAKISLGP